jgi:hypothetical protein
VSNGSSPTSASKKKLYALRPKPGPTAQVQTQRTVLQRRPEAADPESLERGVRQLLADKVSGTLVGLWLLMPEHLRLGTWDLLCTWSGQAASQVEPRLALQLVHEAALCVSGIRQGRGLSQRGFELANGLPFVAADTAIHDLLDARTVAQARTLQIALGLLRRARGHFQAQRLAIDPHRLRSWSQRQMRRHRSQHHQEETAHKMAQTFFVLDVDSHQPVCLTTGTASRTVTQATPELLDLAAAILQPATAGREPALVLADGEHFSAQLVDDLRQRHGFNLLVPMPNRASLRQALEAWPPERFVRRWPGFATAKVPAPRRPELGPLYQLVQRGGEIPGQYDYKSFLATVDRDEVLALTDDFPARWHVEEFFDMHQALGWKRAGTLNLNVRYGQMSLALVAQTVLHQLRQRLGPPYAQWEAEPLAKRLLNGLDGDLRVQGDTIVVTFYNAPDSLRPHYEGLPARLQAEGVDPRIPWLYNFQVDFRFK